MKSSRSIVDSVIICVSLVMSLGYFMAYVHTKQQEHFNLSLFFLVDAVYFNTNSK